MVKATQLVRTQQATVPVTGAQFDISTLLTSIMPLIMLMMVMGMLMPMMKGLTGALASK